MDDPVPSYRIFRDQHGIPQFSPKRGTQALKDALIYSFPTLETELQLMQAALKKFFDSEKGIQIICELPENDLQHFLTKNTPKDVETTPLQEGMKRWKVMSGNGRPSSRRTSRAGSRAGSRTGSRPSSRASSCGREGSVDGMMTTWSLDSGKELDRRKKGPYDPIKRSKVAKNRGNACEKHRACKMTCDPMICAQNKMFGKLSDNMDAVRSQAPGDNVMTRRPSMQKLDVLANEEEIIIIQDEMMNMHENFSTLLTDSNVVWNAQDPMTLCTNSSNLRSSISTSSLADSWTDSTYNDMLPWSPNSSCFTLPDTPVSTLTYPPGMASLDSLPVESEHPLRRMISQADMCDALPSSLPGVQGHEWISDTAPLTDFVEPCTVQKPSLQAAQVSPFEDPFMGWTK